MTYRVGLRWKGFCGIYTLTVTADNEEIAVKIAKEYLLSTGKSFEKIEFVEINPKMRNVKEAHKMVNLPVPRDTTNKRRTKKKV